jgi:internalin A
MKKLLLLIAVMLVIGLFAGCRKLSQVVPRDTSCVPCQNKVTFADANLEKAVRAQLNNQSCDICPNDVLSITQLVIQSQVSNYSGIEKLVNLQKITIQNNTIADFTFVSGLTGINTIDVSSGCHVTSLTGLDSDANPVTITVTQLNLGNAHISDISGLSKLKNLQQLTLNDNQITSLAPLAGMTKLQQLNVTLNQLTTLAGLETDTSLQILQSNWNQISDIGALSGLISLQQISLNTNNLSNIGPLSALTNVTLLDLMTNHITDITALQTMTSLKNVTLSYNAGLFDLTPLVNNTYFGSGAQVQVGGTLVILTDQDVIDLTNKGVTVNFY